MPGAPRTNPAAPRGAQADLAARLRQGADVLHDRLNRRDTLVDVIRTVNATLDPRKVAEALLVHAHAWFQTGCVAVVETTSQQMRVLAERGPCQPFTETMTRIARWVSDRNEEFMSANLESDRRLAEGPSAAVVAFPLRCRARNIGALVALDPVSAAETPALTPSLLSAVRVMLETSALALDATLHLERAQAESVTDDLTGLYNSRYLNQVLRRESKRASRSGRPLSLLFIDLDGFKGVNDRHGHLCGSRALVEAANVIRGCARETDMAARFGGDEFAVVLPETNSEGAVAVGDRVRERVAAHAFLASEGLDIHLTASVGVATLPDVAATAEQLVKAADMAMYRVKDRGKNGILLATRSEL